MTTRVCCIWSCKRRYGLVKAVAQVPTSNDPLNRPLYEVHVNSITLQGFVSFPTNEKENENTPSISFSLSIISIGLLTLLRRNKLWIQ